MTWGTPSYPPSFFNMGEPMVNVILDDGGLMVLDLQHETLQEVFDP